MKQHIQTLNNLMLKNNNKGLLDHYKNSEESENVAQLAYLFHQGMNDITSFDVYQQLSTKLISSKNLPLSLIAQIKTSDTLSFFTSALQLEDNFKKTDHFQSNTLHYLLAGNKSRENKTPFNYLRSMMLFGSNDTLRDALCQRNSKGLTPIEVYLFSNPNFTPLPQQELTALLALIEIERKQQALEINNCIPIVKAIGRLGENQNIPMNSELQRLILIAIYFEKPIQLIVSEVH